MPVCPALDWPTTRGSMATDPDLDEIPLFERVVPESGTIEIECPWCKQWWPLMSDEDLKKFVAHLWSRHGHRLPEKA